MFDYLIVMIMPLLKAFSSYSNGSGYDVKSIQTEMKPDKMCSITLKCFTTPNGGMVSIISCHR